MFFLIYSGYITLVDYTLIILTISSKNPLAVSLPLNKILL